jgi:hypothetical protein
MEFGLIDQDNYALSPKIKWSQTPLLPLHPPLSRIIFPASLAEGVF